MSENKERLKVRAKQAEAIKKANEYGLSIDSNTYPKMSGFRFSEACGLLIHVDEMRLVSAMADGFEPNLPDGVWSDAQERVIQIQDYYWWVQGLYISDHEHLLMRDRSLGFDDVPPVSGQYFSEWAVGKGFVLPACFPPVVTVKRSGVLAGVRHTKGSQFFSELLKAYQKDVSSNEKVAFVVLRDWSEGKSFGGYKGVRLDGKKFIAESRFSVKVDSVREAYNRLYKPV